MSLLNMAMLGWLGLAVPLVAIYLLKVRPIKKLTTTMFLWDEILQERKSSALFRRLRDLLSLLLMLATLALIVIAMSEPVISADQSKDYMILIDRSASMQTKEGSQTRFELAKSEAKSILNAMSMNRKVILASIAEDLSYHVNRTANLKLLLEGLETMQAGIQGLKNDSLKRLLSQKEITSQFRIIFISDSSLEHFEGSQQIEQLIIGKDQENIGISRFDLRYTPGKHQEIGLFFQLSSTYKEDKEIDVILSYDSPDKIVKVCSVTAKPGLSEIEIYKIQNAQAGKWYLSLEHNDALSLDDHAYAVLPEIKAIRTSVHGEGQYFFKHVIEAFNGYENSMHFVEKNADILLANGSIKKDESVENIILFNPQGSSPYWESIGKEEDETLVKVKQKHHPILKYIDWDNVSFKGAKKITPPKGALILLEDEEGNPLLYALNHGNQKVCVINLHPDKSDLYLSAYFPILIFSIAHHQLQLNVESSVYFLPGEETEIKLNDQISSYSLTYPDGNQAKQDGNRIGPFKQLGFYEIDQAGDKKHIACSLIGENESLLNPKERKSTLGPIERGLPPAIFMILIGIGILILESILYHRRKVG